MMVTTSRNASRELKALARELACRSGKRFCLRGGKSIEELVEEARYQGFQKILVVSGKDKRFVLDFVEVTEQGWNPGESFTAESLKEAEKRALLSK